jgi:hypothetical protein
MGRGGADVSSIRGSAGEEQEDKSEGRRRKCKGASDMGIHMFVSNIDLV